MPNSAAGTRGVLLPVTDSGPPERITPLGRNALIAAALVRQL